jgi:glycosyltransferase involved in cell wall biosynthesis
MVIDVVMPARNEVLTVAANVAAARGCGYVRRVIVVDDGSTDGTADLAAEAGADVVRRDAPSGSKAHAMAAGLGATDADTVLFVDADCTGLTAAHLEEICEPYVAGRATMSIGAFDYGPVLNPVILRWVPLSGERVIPRWVFEAIPPDKLDGYTIESRINEVIAEGRLRTVVRTMQGVSHRTKRDKFGPVEGARATWEMFVDLVRLLRGDIRWRAYWYYLQGLTVEPARTPPVLA